MDKDLMPFHVLSASQIKLQLGSRCRVMRMGHLGWSRAKLAELSGVSARTIQRFEETGELGMSNLLALTQAMGESNALMSLFELPEAQSLEEIELRRSRLKPRKSKSNSVDNG